MNFSGFHFAPNTPWALLLAGALLLALLARWAYRFTLPPLSTWSRRGLAWLRGGALIGLLLLLGQPVLERLRGEGATLVVLLDRSRSMDLPAVPGGESRAAAAERSLGALRRAWAGRTRIEVVPFAEGLQSDSTRASRRGVTALGDALTELSRSPLADGMGGVVVLSDGATNQGEDPVAAARVLGVPVHAVVIGDPDLADRAVAELDASATARVGELTPVRVHVTSTEPRGTPIVVRLEEDGRELGRGTALAAGPGAEALTEIRVLPVHPGLALWRARVDSLPGEITTENNARAVAVDVVPSRLGVLVVSAALNWDLTFFRRALTADSGLTVTTRVRERDGWRSLEGRGGAPDAALLRGQSVVVLDAIDPTGVSPEFDRALAGFVRAGGGLLLLGGPPPGVTRFARGELAGDLAVTPDRARAGATGVPAPAAAALDLLQWDDDPARGSLAWRAAAPLVDIVPVAPSAGDRLLIASTGDGVPLLWSRHVGRGQALFVNGSGLWRWSLNAHDELSDERGRRLWRRLVRWLAEPVQGEPLRVRAERWLTPGGEPVPLFATLQDDAFRPVAGAEVTGEIRASSGSARPVRFEPRASGSYVATLEDLPPGRYRASVRAVRDGRELGNATSEFAVDRWSLETARTLPDSVTLAALAAASGGRLTTPARVAAWAQALNERARVRPRSESLRLWESPWLFALVVGALSTEWMLRRRRGLP